MCFGFIFSTIIDQLVSNLTYLPSVSRLLHQLHWSPRFCALAADFYRLKRGSTGLWPAPPIPDIILFEFVRPTSLFGPVNHSPSPKTATNFPCPAGRPFLARQIGVRFCGKHFLRKCGRLTAPFRAMGRALPSPTLFRRIYAYSVRSSGRGAAHRRKEGTKPRPRNLEQEATNGTEI